MTTDVGVGERVRRTIKAVVILIGVAIVVAVCASERTARMARIALGGLLDSPQSHRLSKASLPPLELLHNPKEVVGEWNRIEFPDAVIPVNWRWFANNGEYRVRYGDVIVWGMYTFIDEKTIETIEGHDGRTHRWAVGLLDGKLVMAHHKHDWVEKYERVPDGTFIRE
jgi:hypothetical protein